ncbi:MAG: CHAT domain-containing protein [Acidobacteriota bacterium]
MVNYRTLACLGTILLALPGDGGGGNIGVPAGPVTAAPPFAQGDPLGWIERALQRGQSRRAMAGYAERLSADPSELTAALGLVRGAVRAGADDWLHGYLAALRRRAPTAAVGLAVAEAAFATGDRQAGRDAADRAHRARPASADIAYTLAAGRAAMGDIVAAFEAVSGWQLQEPMSSMGVGSAQRSAAFAALLDPVGAGRRRAVVAWARGRRHGDPLDQARSLVLLSTVEGLLDDSRAAQRTARRALQLGLAGGDPMTTARSLVRLAETDDERSLQPISLLRAACRSLGPQRGTAWVDCMLSVLRAAWDAGLPQEGLSLYRLVAPLAAGSSILELRLAATALPLLQASGRILEAVRLAESAAAAANGLLQPRLEAHYLVRLAGLCRLLGDATGAESAALAALAAAPVSSIDVAARALAERAEVALAMGEGRRAAALLRQAEQMSLRGSGNNSDFAVYRLRLELKLGRSSALPVGGDDSGRARSPSPVAEDTPAAILSAVIRGLSMEASGHLEFAWEAYHAAMEKFTTLTDRLGDAPTRALMTDAWHDLNRRAMSVALALDRPALALDALEAGRRWAGERGGWPPAGSSWSGNDVGGEAQSGTGDTGEDHSWRRLSRNLSAQTAIVVYAFGADNVWALVLRHGQLRALKLPVEAEALRHQVRLWRAAITQPSPAGLWRQVSVRLSSVLLDPLERAGYLDGVRTVYAVTDDILQLLPLSTLPVVGVEGSLYGERYTWARAPSLAALDFAMRQLPRQGPWIAFGPAGGSDTIAELQSVIEQHQGAIFLGPRASESRWREKAREAAVLHFAGHAALDGADPGAGRLSLRGDGLADGRLTVGEILQLDLRGATVVLLGCDTAIPPPGLDSGGGASGLPSLSEAFLWAGARSVVGNLWAVTERDARQLAAAFYRMGGPWGGAGSLERARRQLRRRWPDNPERWAGAVWQGVAVPLTPYD